MERMCISLYFRLAFSLIYVRMFECPHNYIFSMCVTILFVHVFSLQLTLIVECVLSLLRNTTKTYHSSLCQSNFDHYKVSKLNKMIGIASPYPTYVVLVFC